MVYYRVIRPRALARQPPRNIELVSRPSVLILYTDDCFEHSNAVMAVSNLLARHANANVSIDQLDLIDPSMEILFSRLVLGVKPSLWLMNKFSDAQFILIIFSEAAKRVMAGEQLVQRRPFQDLFSSAIRMVVSVGSHRERIKSLENQRSKLGPTDQRVLQRSQSTRPLSSRSHFLFSTSSHTRILLPLQMPSVRSSRQYRHAIGPSTWNSRVRWPRWKPARSHGIKSSNGKL